MTDLGRSLLVLAGAFAGVVAVTVALSGLIVGDSNVQTVERPDSGGPIASPSTAEIVAPTGIGGLLVVSGDRAETLLLDREVIEDAYSLAGDDGRVFFEGLPALVSRIQVDGLSFYLDPEDCEHTVGERDASSGLVPLDVSCVGVTDVRDTATLTVEGTLRLPADQLGVRGDLPATGGELAIGNETLSFDDAAMDLRRPAVVETGRGSYSRYPPVYPVVVSAENGSLEFEYDSTAAHLRLLGVEVSGADGRVEGDCTISLRALGRLSPRVTVAEMSIDCPAVDFTDVGTVTLSGTLVIDIAELPASGLR